MKREEIVMNGCSGKCCSNFTLSWSFETIDEAIKKYIKEEQPVEIGKQMSGRSFGICLSNFKDILKTRDLLIPLGLSDTDPKTGRKHNEQMKIKEYEEKIGRKINEEDVESKRPGYVLKDGIIYSHNFTCKESDTENKICKIYEDRPNMCKSYSCQSGDCYEGCGMPKVNENNYMSKIGKFAKKLEDIDKKENLTFTDSEEIGE